jgi:hypothetical protein
MLKIAAYLATALKLLFDKANDDYKIAATYTAKEIDDAIDFKFSYECEQGRKYIWRKGYISELFKILKKRYKNV